MNNNLFKAGVSRRGFLTGSAALCVMAGLGLTGCGGSGAESGSAAASGQDVEYRDELQIALPASPDGLDPHTTSSLVTMDIICNVVEPLFGQDSDYEPRPVLAKGYEVSDDGLTYTIKLREGVKFHDGTDFNADAVKTSIERLLEPNRNSDQPYASFVFGEEAANSGVKTVEAVDATTVKIAMRAANTSFLKNLAMALASPIVSPKAIEAASAGSAITTPCGTGPYKFVDWTKSASVTLEANEDYWDKDNAPKTKNIIFKIIAEGNTRITSLLNGE